jgi:excisionase family DNA binding protein
MSRTFITVKEAAEYLRVSKELVYILARDKEFPAIKIKGSVRIDAGLLEKWIDKQYKDKPEIWTT